MNQQKGFAFLEAVLIVVGVALVGTVGYMAYTHFMAPKTQETTTVNSSSTSTPVTVKTKADLDTATTTLDSVRLTTAIHPNLTTRRIASSLF